MIRRARILAPAKVNLWLRILGRRPDGFHDIDTAFQAIALYDEVTLELGGDSVDLVVEGPDLGPPAENLAVRAASAFQSEGWLEEGVRIALLKGIPAGAGLGGGSSDAAAVLKALAWMTGLGASERLMEIGGRLGSDVPFFLGRDPVAVGSGRGEVLTPVPRSPVEHLVLSLPPVHVATAWAYGAMADQRTEKIGPSSHRVSSRGLAASPPAWAPADSWLRNDFEGLVAAEHSEVAASLAAFLDAGAKAALLSGSGAASFGVFDSEVAALEAASVLTKRLGWPCLAVRTLGTMPSPTRLG